MNEYHPDSHIRVVLLHGVSGVAMSIEDEDTHYRYPLPLLVVEVAGRVYPIPMLMVTPHT